MGEMKKAYKILFGKPEGKEMDRRLFNDSVSTAAVIYPELYDKISRSLYFKHFEEAVLAYFKIPTRYYP
jgi:hypothetical protein